MAIKVNGTTVINDSRQLQNVASIDTATKNAISNAGVGGFTEVNFNQPTSTTPFLTTYVPTKWRTDATSSTAPTSSDGLVASFTLTSTSALVAMTISTDMTKITWTNFGGLWSGGMFLWAYNPALPSGAQYVNFLGTGGALFNMDLAGGGVAPILDNYYLSKSLAKYGAGTVLYLLGGRTYSASYGGITCAANFLSIASYQGGVA